MPRRERAQTGYGRRRARARHLVPLGEVAREVRAGKTTDAGDEVPHGELARRKRDDSASTIMPISSGTTHGLPPELGARFSAF